METRVGVNGVVDDSIAPSEAELDRYVAPAPQHFGLEITARCNLQCPMCHNHGRGSPERFLGQDMKLDVIDLLGPTLRTAREVLLSGGGEPMVLPNFFEFVYKCHEYNPSLDVTFISNGVLLSERKARAAIESRVHLIEFSMDGTIQYGHVGGGADYDQVKDNLRRLARLKQEYGVEEPLINIAFVAMRDNLCELPELIRFAREIDAKVRVQPLSPTTEEQRSQNVFRHVDYTKRVLEQCKLVAKQLDVQFEYKNMTDDMDQVPHKCSVPESWLWMGYDGRLDPCCGGLTTGRNIYEENLSVEELWNGPFLRRLRWELDTGNYNETCGSCPLLWNTIEKQERAIQSSPILEEEIERVEKENERLEEETERLKEETERSKERVYDLEAHLEAIRRGKVMRVLRTVDRLLGRS